MLLFRCLPLSVTAQFKRFFDCGRALRCLLPVASGRFLHLVVLYSYQGADGDVERLSLTDQLLDAALGELRVVTMDQPCLIVGDFNVEPTKIPCLSKGISAGLWVDLESSWVNVLGAILVVIVGISWLVALLLRLRLAPVLFSWIGGLFLIMLLGLLFFILGGLVRFLSLFGVRPLACFLVAGIG